MITELKNNQVFIFGSNENGNHAGGAAKLALAWGAVEGVAEGLQGQTYAFPTLDKRMWKLSQTSLKKSVSRLCACAKENPDKEFLLTKVGCGIARFTENEIAPLFKDAPRNIIQPDWDI